MVAVYNVVVYSSDSSFLLQRALSLSELARGANTHISSPTTDPSILRQYTRRFAVNEKPPALFSLNSKPLPFLFNILS
jgi:hypothetical protein